MLKQNIDIFNLKGNFYTDICFHFDSPLNKDITLKDRFLLFFPNITLCENGCSIKGVNLETMRAICECKFNNLINKNKFSDNIWYKSQIGQIQEILSQTNIEIIKCIKEFFKYKYCIYCIGSYIILSFIITQIISSIIYFKKSLYPIKKYIFDITDKFILHLLNKKNKEKKIFEPNKRKSRTQKMKTIKNKDYTNNTNKNYILKKLDNSNKIIRKKKYNTNKFLIINNINNMNNSSSGYSPKGSERELKTHKNDNKLIYKRTKSLNIKDENSIANNDKNFNIKDYLKTEYDDMVFADAIKKDKRKFCNYFSDKIKSNLMIVNTFIEEPFKPTSLKVLLLILDVDLYFFINALFFNEEFISKIFHSNKKDNFFSFIPRCIDRLFYITFAGLIINYLIEYFFIEEKIFKAILKREKESEIILKYEITQMIKNIFNRFIYFTIISFIISIFSFYHISCFNNIYPHMTSEWIKSSVFILLIKQILGILIIFLETFIRFISFKCKSEKIYKLALFLS
jgi:hypothetical protein